MIDRLIDPDENEKEIFTNHSNDDYKSFKYDTLYELTDEEWNAVKYNWECVIYHERDRLVNFGRVKAHHF